MGSRLPKPEFTRTTKEKTVDFRSKFLEESAVELKEDCSPNSSSRNSPIASRKNKSLSLPVLSVDCILSLLDRSKDKGAEAYQKVKSKHLRERKLFRTTLGDWGVQYEGWCELIQNNYMELLDRQYKEQELQDSLKLYMSHPEIAQGLHDMNEFEPASKIKFPLTELFQILHFRTERAEELRGSLDIIGKQRRLMIIKAVVEDETVMRFGHDDLELSWSIRAASEDLDATWQVRLSQLQERFSATCC
mmetsp:Transcript_19793/g.36490  ORF Transcript_19793/g.36490 Transcript_19793/m.36490 type:complete len:247 (+) Transcript_19793:1323-2063(+)